jgi:hypothetical protein
MKEVRELLVLARELIAGNRWTNTVHSIIHDGFRAGSERHLVEIMDEGGDLSYDEYSEWSHSDLVDGAIDIMREDVKWAKNYLDALLWEMSEKKVADLWLKVLYDRKMVNDYYDDDNEPGWSKMNKRQKEKVLMTMALDSYGKKELIHNIVNDYGIY